MIDIVAVGDIMPGGVLNGRKDEFVTDEVRNVLSAADVRVGTLETAIGNEPTFYEEKMSRRADVIYAKDEDLKRLKELNINIVSLANNHFFDLGPDGAEHTIALLDAMQIRHCGAGRNIEEASKPVVFEKDGFSIAFLAFCDWREETVGWCPFATETSAGVNPMTDVYVVDEIKKYKKLYDYVVVIPHWGKEHTFITTRHVYRLADKMIAAGADVVLGGHTHKVQPVIRKRNKIIAYSLGNFLFPDRLIVKPRSTYYPEQTVDISKLPVTDRYPFVEELTLKIWKPLARVGCMASVSLDNDRLSFKTYFVKMEAGNVLGLYNVPAKIRVPLLWQRFWLKYMPYSGYDYIVANVKRIIKKIIK